MDNYKNYFRSAATIFFMSVCLIACDNEPVLTAAVESPQGFSDVAGVKLKVGSPAPEFSLTGLDNKTHALNDYVGSDILLVFYRGHWCPFCIGHLEDIQSIFSELENRGIKIIAISPDDNSGLQSMADRLDKSYLFLSDTTLEVIEHYGIRKDEELPHPAVVLIDKEGVVRWFYVGEDYKVRPSASQIKQVIDRLNLESAK